MATTTPVSASAYVALLNQRAEVNRLRQDSREQLADAVMAGETRDVKDITQEAILYTARLAVIDMAIQMIETDATREHLLSVADSLVKPLTKKSTMDDIGTTYGALDVLGHLNNS